MKPRTIITLVIFSLFWCGCAHSQDIYRVKKNRLFLSSTAIFCYEILEQALAATYSKRNSFNLEYVIVDDAEFTHMLMSKGNFTDMLDITFGIPRPHWENQLLVIRVPLFMGYMGKRVHFVHQANIEKFSHITHVDQLKSLRVGSGKGWATTPILKAHGFNTLGAKSPPALIKQLMKKRIDYIARGATEILAEYKKYKTEYHNLAIEPNLMVRIPLPFYFFVNPRKPELGQRLHMGLLKLIKSGEYQKIFNKHFGDFISELKLDTRIVFDLDNPYISHKSRENALNFWQKAAIEHK